MGLNGFCYEAIASLCGFANRADSDDGEVADVSLQARTIIEELPQSLNLASMNRRALDTTKIQVAFGALHNSEERSRAPRCLEGTRTKVIAELMKWIQARPCLTRILCMTGPAGSGKTAIKQTVADFCESKALLAATFFFSASSLERRNAKLLITTIAIQVAQAIPETRPFIEDAIESDAFISGRSLTAQTKALLINPLRLAKVRQLSAWPSIVIIDGLDECEGEENQTEILSVLHAAVVEQGLPLRFLISSRPEYAIRSALKSFLRDSAYLINLDQSYNPDADIELYLWTEFAAIRNNHPSFTAASDLWPREADIWTIRDEASGQFVYASTVVKFVGNRYHDPCARFKLILEWSTSPEFLDQSNNTPFSPLDRLYAHILRAAQESIRDQTNDDLAIVRLLKNIDHLVGSTVRYPFRVGNFESLFELQPGSVARFLSDMHSLVDIPHLFLTINQITYHHKSFMDFLNDPRRAGPYFLSSEDVEDDQAAQFLRCISIPSVHGEASPLHQLSRFNPSFPSALRDAIFSERLGPLECAARMWVILIYRSRLTDELLTQLVAFLPKWKEFQKFLDPWQLLTSERQDFGKLTQCSDDTCKIDHPAQLVAFRDSIQQLYGQYDKERCTEWLSQSAAEHSKFMSDMIIPDNLAHHFALTPPDYHSRFPLESSSSYFGALLRDVHEWCCRERLGEKKMLCVIGPPQSCKTALLFNLSDILQSRRGFFAASYFLSVSTGANAGRLFPTIAFQLASQPFNFNSSMRSIICQELEQSLYPSSRSLEDQLKALIVDPLHDMDRLHGSGLIVIDALDECEEQEQFEILHALAKMLVEAKLPFKVIISSRPVSTITHALETYLHDIAYHIDLRQSYHNTGDIIDNCLLEHACEHIDRNGHGKIPWSETTIQALKTLLLSLPTPLTYLQKVISYIENLPSGLQTILSHPNPSKLLDDYTEPELAPSDGAATVA